MKSKQLLIILLTLINLGCNKTLDKKPNKALVVPSTLQDLQAILDDNYRINLLSNFLTGEASADNFYLKDADWAAFYFQADKSIYLWDKEIFYDLSASQNEWASLYSIVYRANTVLEQINRITTTTQNLAQWNSVKGSAFFLRAYAFGILARNYAKAYDSSTAATDPGIPLRLGSDFNEPSVRATVRDTYTQLIADLKSAIPLLPGAPQHVMRPSKGAGYGLLARAYLCLHDYRSAGQYADSALLLSNTLMDYNHDASIDSNALIPFAKFNSEVIFEAEATQSSLYYDIGKIDSLLYRSYETNDLRKKLFFSDNRDGTFGFRGNYTADISLFCGIATDELYLTRAECYAKEGLTDKALIDLNNLLIKRWKTGTFVPYTAANSTIALAQVLTERRKELLMRDLRWMDIKRLNKEGANISIIRKLNGQTYSLQPNDNRFALPFPADIIKLSGMPQNPR